MIEKIDPSIIVDHTPEGSTVTYKLRALTEREKAVARIRARATIKEFALPDDGDSWVELAPYEYLRLGLVGVTGAEWSDKIDVNISAIPDQYKLELAVKVFDLCGLTGAEKKTPS